jgi:hypothetical protein
MNTFEVQAWLRSFGEKDLMVDGVPGPRTSAAAKRILAQGGVTDYADPILAAEQLIMKHVGGLATGPVDGILGPATEKARIHWVRGPWRNGLMDTLPGDFRMPQELKRWPKYSNLVEFFGEPGQNLVTVSVPFPLRPSWDPHKEVHRVTCHKLVADSLIRVQKDILRAYGYDGVKRLHLDIWGGCYSARPMRGSGKLSTHAWGIAWDTDPLRNALRWDKKKAQLARPEYEEFWAAWTKEGWLSLGKARDFDWMHTQACQLG